MQPPSPALLPIRVPATVRRPSLPSSILPKLSRSLSSSSYTSSDLLSLIAHLRLLYRTEPSSEPLEGAVRSSELEEDLSVDPLHQHDAFERSWASTWLGLIVKRGEDWIDELDEEEGDQTEERERRVRLVEEAAGLVAHLSATSGSLFSFSSVQGG